nr:MAG TPA: hypothetical protein [Caudoviricetes sp.]
MRKAHGTISLAAQDFATGQCRKYVKRAKARTVKSGTMSESGICNDELDRIPEQRVRLPPSPQNQNCFKYGKDKL